MEKILEMLPFLGREDLLELAKECLEGNVDLSIEEILPFMNTADVDALFNQLRNENSEIELTLTGENVHLSDMMPFLSQQLIDDLFLSQAEKEINVDSLPFVSEEALHKLVLKYAENPDLQINVDELYPFLSAKDISILFKTYLARHKKEKKPGE